MASATTRRESGALFRQPRDKAALDLAYRTLRRGAAFLGHGLRQGDRLEIQGHGRLKVIGNGLRELDGFLNLLADQIIARVAPLAFDQARSRRQRNTPNKLLAALALMSRPSPHHARLRAIGRSRDCLFHTGGIARRGGIRSFAAIAAGEEGALAMGDRLHISARDLACLCAYYDHVAADLLAALEAHLRSD